MNKEDLYDAIGEVSDRLAQEAGEIKTRDGRARILRRTLAAAAVIVLAVAAAALIPRLLPKRVTPDQTATMDPDQETPSEAAGPADAPEATENAVPETRAPETREPTMTLSADALRYAEIAAVYPESLDLFDAGLRGEEYYGYSKTDAKALALSYFSKTIGAFLGDQTKENAVFSPFDLFFQLGALAEMTDGSSREQILDLLGFDDVEALRTTARALFLSDYRDCGNDGETRDLRYENRLAKLIPAASFWLNGDVELTGDAAAANALRENYFTSFFKGDPSDPGYSLAFRSWISTQTDGLLDDFSDRFTFDERTLFQSVSTLLYKAEWDTKFDPENNATAPFYGASGETTATYMTEKDADLYVYEADGYVACAKGLSAGMMWFYLPEEGKSVTDLLRSGDYMEPIEVIRTGGYDVRERAFTPKEPEYDLYEVDLSIPKFDVAASFDLKGPLGKLGVTDVFDEIRADIPFIRLPNGENVFLQKGEQDARLTIDENGVAAASATMMGFGYGDPRFKHVELTFDRPFLAVLCAPSGAPLFAAVINNAE